MMWIWWRWTQCWAWSNTYVVFDVDIAGRPFWRHSVLFGVLPATDAAIHSYSWQKVVVPHIAASAHCQWKIIVKKNCLVGVFELREIFKQLSTYIWSALVCSSAVVSWRVSASSFIDSRWLASSATRGWKSNDFFNGVPTDESDIGSSLSTKSQNTIKLVHTQLFFFLFILRDYDIFLTFNTYSRIHLLDQLAWLLVHSGFHGHSCLAMVFS